MFIRFVRDIAVVLLGAWTILATSVRRLLRGPKHPDWSFRYEIVAEVMRAVMRLGHDRMSIQLQRKQPTPPLTRGLRQRVDWQQGTIAGLPAETHTPRGWQPGDTTILHYHGGGYTMCTPATHRVLLASIAHSSSARVIAPNYRKAPEHPFPAGVDDGFAAYEQLLSEGIDPATLVLAGDSAGGGMALAVMLRARDRGLPLPRASVLLSPWVDLTLYAGGTIDDNAPYDYLQGDMLQWAIGVYLDGVDPLHPEASPGHADLAGLPPLLVQSGGGEIFLGQNNSFVQRARDAGVDVVHEITGGMVHVFQIFSPFPTARQAVRSIGAYVRSSGQTQAAAE